MKMLQHMNSADVICYFRKWQNFFKVCNPLFHIQFEELQKPDFVSV